MTTAIATTAETLGRAMRRKKLTARELSEKTGVADTLIRRYLTGKVGIGAKNAPRLAKVLGISPVSLIPFGPA